MKKLSIIAFLFACTFVAQAQHPILPFFDDKGAVRLETQELNDAADTLATVFHRADDIVWSRIVYRVIDMRYKQNYQLYFPTRYDDPEYRSLFKVIVDALIDGLPAYRKADNNIKPQFTEVLSKSELSREIFLRGTPAEGDDDFFHTARSNATILNYDTIPDKLTFNPYSYAEYAQNQLKYLIQEIVFFDKHTSRVHSKIIAIAPLKADDIKVDSTQVGVALNQSMLFWLSFDELRPYLAKQFIIPQTNDTKRVTFEEFFAKKLYTSYLVGDSNMYGRTILDYARSEDEVHKEQQKLEDELLNFEQDLWEY